MHLVEKVADQELTCVGLSFLFILLFEVIILFS